MSRIKALCPDGVRYCLLGEVATFQRGKQLKESDRIAGPYPVVTAGRVESARHGEWNHPGPSITVTSHGAHAGHVNFWEGPIWLANNVFLLQPNDQLGPRYFFYVLKSLEGRLRAAAKGGGVPYINVRDIESIRIPVPPLNVQRATVRVLDKFTQLEAELEAELEARRAQYEYYRGQLLDEAGEGATRVALGDLGHIVTGRTPKSSGASAWGAEVDFITPSDIRNGMKVVTAPGRKLSGAGAVSMAKAMIPARSLLVTCIGADMGKTVINANACVTNQQINSIIPSMDVVAEYFFHLLTSMRDQLRTQGERAGGTMPLINKTDFSKIEVLVPSVEVQSQVAARLDRFDALVNDISAGLPAELTVRRQQYEYYRDRLLAFKEPAA